MNCWFKVNWSVKDREILAKWQDNIGQNIKFYDEETNSYYLPPEELDSLINFIPLVQSENEHDKPKNIQMEYDYKKGKLRYYKPRKSIPKKTKILLENTRGFECEVCRITEYHDIHHIDGNPSNNMLENLRMVCIKCHRQLNAIQRTKKN